MSLRTCLGPAEPAPQRAGRRGPAPGDGDLLPLPRRRSTTSSTPSGPRSRRRRLDATFALCRRSRRAGDRLSDWLVDEAEAAVPAGAASSSCSDDRGIAPSVRRYRCCWPSVRSTTASSPPGCARTPRSSSTPATPRDSHRSSPASSATAPTPSARAWRWRASPSLADNDQLGEANSAEAQDRLQAAIEDGVLKIAVQDGDLHRRRLPRRADLRGRRSRPTRSIAALPGGHRVACRRHRLRHTCRRRPVRATRPPCARRREPVLDNPGFVRFRKGGEYHATNPDVIEALHSTWRRPARRGDPEPGAAKDRSPPNLRSPRRRTGSRSTAGETGRQPGGGAGGRAPCCSSAAVVEAARTCTTGSPSWSTTRPPTELARPARARARQWSRFRSTRSSRPRRSPRRFSTGAMSHGALSRRGARDAGAGHEPASAAMQQLRRGRRGPAPLPHPDAQTATRGSSRSPPDASA